MPYKDMKVKIGRFSNDKERVYGFVKSEYEKIVEDYKKTGQSLEGATYEILEIVEKGIEKKDKEIENILKNISSTILETARKSAFENIKKNEKEFKRAYDSFIDSIEREKCSYDEIIKALYSYDKDKNRHLFDETIKHLKKDIKEIDKIKKLNSQTVMKKDQNSWLNRLTAIVKTTLATNSDKF